MSTGTTPKRAWRGAKAPVVVTSPQNTFAGRDLIALHGLSAGELRQLLFRAREVEQRHAADSRPGSELAGKTVATMFFEDSTRTRVSFSLAARRLGADVSDLSALASSVNKGETLIDTARTIEAMGVDAMIVRVRQSGGAGMIADAVACPVINAGDGRHEHPTQGLLDIYTLAVAHKRLDTFDLSGLTVVIVGDVGSSRVARSAIAGMTTLGAKVFCIGPATLAPKSMETLGCTVGNSLDDVLEQADAVKMLRIQFERHEEKAGGIGAEVKVGKSPVLASVREFREFYTLTSERAARMKPGAVVMHPGPINRGIELDHEVADGPRSVIRDQVAHGVAVRQAVLSLCVVP